jgi:hypothetical protein
VAAVLRPGTPSSSNPAINGHRLKAVITVATAGQHSA